MNESLRHHWYRPTKAPVISDFLREGETHVWSHFFDDEMLLSNYDKPILIRAYAYILGHLFLVMVGVYGVYWRLSELRDFGFSFSLAAWICLFVTVFIWAAYSVYIEIRDLYFPGLRFKNNERFFLITNQRLLKTNGAWRIIQEMRISEIAGFADLACENTTEWDEDDEEGYERELHVIRKGEPSPFSNTFYFHHLPDKNKVMNVIKELAK